VFQLLLLVFFPPQGHVTLCVNVGHPEKREVWPFQALDVVRTHQRGETTNSPQKTKKTNITIYGQATHIFTPAPTPA
jgi:hypothetical protein